MSQAERENFLDWRYKHINSQPKLHYVLAEHVSRMLNFRLLNVTPVETWGYPVDNTSSYGGVIGMLQRGEIEMASFGLFFKAARMNFLDYAGETVRYDAAFLFLKPSLSDVSNIYTLPFSRAVWVTYLVTMVVFSYALHITQRTESGIDDSKGTRSLSLSDSLLTAIGIACQEGSSRDPRSLSSRIIFLSLLMLSLFLTTSYSAIIVSLLQTTSTAINSLKDLMNSPYTLSMNEFATNMNYVNETTDTEIKDLYFKHLFTQPYHEAFTKPAVGVAKISKGLYAYHGDADAFKIISETYDEYEKCRLKSIKMFSSLQLAFAVKKGTPYKEHIRQRARWLKESGISDREYKYWIVQKPKCHGNTEGFTSVRLQDVFPALLVFIYGLVLAGFVLILEILFHNFHCFKCRHYRAFPSFPYSN
ncbi:glutamate receptor 4-like [Cryptotermes secundus]|uniref:glutamate receptor 4-like n=1 Tax=Cryptotermes secundus TaxID=105785 RepID=UPI001454CFA3|nr:glutamate receptor 4-like [Cryptotermes secundus]